MAKTRRGDDKNDEVSGTGGQEAAIALNPRRCCAAEQAAGHPHGGEDGNTALQQYAQRAIEARQLVHHQTLVQCWQAP